MAMLKLQSQFGSSSLNRCALKTDAGQHIAKIQNHRGIVSYVPGGPIPAK
jgi:hypothetical protein